MAPSFNPIRSGFIFVGSALAGLGLIDRHRVVRATDLSWPRVVTGIARMSKSAADVAMVGLAVGPVAIAGIGFALPYWGFAFAIGGGIAGASIALVSQRFGAEQWDELALAVRTSAVLALAITIPIAVLLATVPDFLIGLLSSDEPAVVEGANYLRVIAFGIPFAALNLVGSRVLVGCDDAWIPMVIRGGGAVVNIGLNAVFIFGLGLGVAGAALGTVVANVIVSVTFAIGLSRGHLPLIGQFPVRVPLLGRYVELEMLRDAIEIGTPLMFTNLARTSSSFPKFLLLGMLGPNVVAAYVIAMRVRGLMGTPGWGFSLASSSLVGQELGIGDEGEAEAWANDILRFAIAIYLIVSASVFVSAEQVGRLFVDDPSILPLVTVFIYAACISVIFNGVDGASTGPLRASGDTRWPFYAQLTGRYVVALPLLYLGIATPLGVSAVYGVIIAEMLVPAAIVYYRFRTGTWKSISREYRPKGTPSH